MKKIIEIRESVKRVQPLIHCITNPISMNPCANAILAVGARPIMAEHPKEVCEITETADALMLNTGTISDVRMESMHLSAKVAERMDIPVLLDAVGVACTSLRRSYVMQILAETKVTVLKGNYSEIMALYDDTYHCVGVDAHCGTDIHMAESAAVALADKYQMVVLASGKTDLITDGRRIVHMNNGVAQLAALTGTGCMLGALTTTYLSSTARTKKNVCESNMDAVDAAVCACAVLGISGELAETEQGNGSFFVGLLDQISTLTDVQIAHALKKTEHIRKEE